jgi:hypothetical protein
MEKENKRSTQTKQIEKQTITQTDHANRQNRSRNRSKRINQTKQVKKQRTYTHRQSSQPKHIMKQTHAQTDQVKKQLRPKNKNETTRKLQSHQTHQEPPSSFTHKSGKDKQTLRNQNKHSKMHL